MQESSPCALVVGLISSQNIITEHEQLDQLLTGIKKSSWLKDDCRNPTDGDDLESDFLAKARFSDVELSSIPKELLQNQECLQDLVFYIFERRFGWSEQERSQNGLSRSKQTSAKGNTSSGSTRSALNIEQLSYAEESKIKTELNHKLDELINLLATEEKLNSQLLEAYVFAMSKATSMPVVRSQLLCHIFKWLTLAISDDSVITGAIFHLIKLIIISGVTDVWSAIRNATVSRITAFIECFTLDQLEDIFGTFSKICNNYSSTWQAKEGAIMAIAGTLQCFKLAIVQKSVLDEDASNSCGTVVCRKFGRHHFTSLPSFIVEPLQTTVYRLLSNAQLSIKEHANRAFSSFLLRSEISQVLSAFKEVLLYLATKSFCRKQECTSEWRFAEASSVDGFIKAAEFLIKHVPVDYILHNWNLCFATFSHYLMHPASTVRQAASSVLKYLAAKQTQTLLFPQLVTQSLLFSWKSNIKLLTEPLSMRAAVAQRSSVKCIEKNCNFDITESWEWREGRLLAYELILKFLITNHIHYTFPAYTLTRSMQSRSPRDQHRKSIDIHNKFSVSHNFGSKHTKGFSRHEPLSRSLTMESDPVTQKFVSSLVEKEKAKTQTFSLLELMRKSDKEIKSTTFGNMQGELLRSNSLEICVTQDSIKRLKDFTEEQLSTTNLPMKLPNDLSFGSVLMQIFVQTLECLADTRWELRRMAHQVLPLISEAMRFYDASILENLWESHLSCNSSLLGFGACVSLRDSLAHIAKLVNYFENPPEFWKDIERCRLAAKKIVDSINTKLPNLLVKVMDVVNRASFDRLTIMSIEILMLSAIHFPQEQLRHQMIPVVVHKIEQLFSFANPDSPYAVALTASTMKKGTEFQSATAGVLSCAPKNMNAVSRASKVQNTLFIDVQRHLSAFLRSLEFDDVVSFLPIILHEISQLVDGTTDIQPLFQACCALLKENTTKKTELSQSAEKVLQFAVEEICNTIRTKALETHFLRQYLDILSFVLGLLDKSANLQHVFIAIATNLRSEGYPTSAVEQEASQKSELVRKNSDDEFLRIRMLSNDIRQSPIEDVHILAEDEQEDSPRDLLESQALGLMFDAKCNVDKADEQRDQSPVEREVTPFDEDFDSDWDSWEEDEESLSQIKSAFGSFLLHIKLTSTSEMSFNQALDNCESQDRKIIKSLLSDEDKTEGL